MACPIAFLCTRSAAVAARLGGVSVNGIRSNKNILKWIWLKIIDTPNRWFPTKYDHSCGSFGTIILSHCQVSLVAHTRCQLISLACCRRLVAHQHAHLRGHWEWCLGNSQPLPHAATKLPQSYSHNEKFSKKTVSNMLSVAHLFWCFDFYDWLVVWNIVYFPIYWG